MSNIQCVTPAKGGAIVFAAVLLTCVSGTPLAEHEQESQSCTSVVSGTSEQKVQCVIDENAAKWIKFQNLIRQWRDERGAMSSITGAAMLPSYQSIIGMGEEALPLILAQLKSERDEPDQWFWALRAITGANPVRPEDQGNFAKMAQAWLQWANEGYAAS